MTRAFFPLSICHWRRGSSLETSCSGSENEILKCDHPNERYFLHAIPSVLDFYIRISVFAIFVSALISPWLITSLSLKAVISGVALYLEIKRETFPNNSPVRKRKSELLPYVKVFFSTDPLTPLISNLDSGLVSSTFLFHV